MIVASAMAQNAATPGLCGGTPATGADRLSPTANLDSSYGCKELAMSAFPLERDGR